MGRKLLLVAAAPVSRDEARRMKDEAESMLGVEVVVVSGMNQALIVEDDPKPPPRRSRRWRRSTR